MGILLLWIMVFADKSQNLMNEHVGIRACRLENFKKFNKFCCTIMKETKVKQYYEPLIHTLSPWKGLVEIFINFIQNSLSTLWFLNSISECNEDHQCTRDNRGACDTNTNMCVGKRFVQKLRDQSTFLIGLSRTYNCVKKIQTN